MDKLLDAAREICGTLAEIDSMRHGGGAFGGEVYRDGMCDDLPEVQRVLAILNEKLGRSWACVQCGHREHVPWECHTAEFMGRFVRCASCLALHTKDWRAELGRFTGCGPRK